MDTTCNNNLHMYKYGFHHLKTVLTLQMETARSSEMLLSYHITTWCHDPDRDLVCHENL